MFLSTNERDSVSEFFKVFITLYLCVFIDTILPHKETLFIHVIYEMVTVNLVERTLLINKFTETKKWPWKIGIRAQNKSNSPFLPRNRIVINKCFIKFNIKVFFIIQDFLYLVLFKIRYKNTIWNTHRYTHVYIYVCVCMYISKWLRIVYKSLTFKNSLVGSWKRVTYVQILIILRLSFIL